MRKTWIICSLVLAAAFFTGTALAEGVRIAVVDVNKVLNQSESGKAAKKKMETRYEELKKTIEAKQSEAKKLKDEIDKQKVMLGKEKLKEKEESLQAKVAELRKLTQEGEQEMQRKQGELTRELLKHIEAQIETLVKAEKFDLVLERSAGVIHVADTLDITARVLELVNKNPVEPGSAKEPAAKKGAAGKKEAGSGK
jgi:outer membrane protein